jgi:hypothetical protein
LYSVERRGHNITHELVREVISLSFSLRSGRRNPVESQSEPDVVLGGCAPCCQRGSDGAKQALAALTVNTLTGHLAVGSPAAIPLCRRSRLNRQSFADMCSVILSIFNLTMVLRETSWVVAGK